MLQFAGSVASAVCCLLVVAVWLSSLVCAQVTPESLSITSIRGCTDRPPTTVNCSWPASLVVALNGSLQSADVSSFQLLLSSAAIVLSAELLLDAADPSNSTLLATVLPQGYDPTIAQQLLDASLLDATNGRRSQPFNGVSFAYEPPPSLQSISGCEGSGSITTACVPATSVLTLVGAGFKWLTGYSDELWIGSAHNYFYTALPLAVLNDSYAVLPLLSVQAYVLVPSHYGGAVLPFSIALRRYVGGSFLRVFTNALRISFVPLPPPSLTGSQLGAYCSQVTNADNSSTYNNCLPEVGLVILRGLYLYEANVSVGGKSCFTQPQPLLEVPDSTAFNCYLPLIDGFVAEQPYDLLLSSYDGDTVYPGFVSFSSAPAISQMSRCTNVGTQTSQQYGGYCQPGSIITIQGSSLLNDSAMAVRISKASFTLSCEQPTFVSSTQLTCVLPVAQQPTLFYGSSALLQVLFPSTNASSNPLSLTVYNYPNPPHVTSVSGCDTVLAPLSSAGCRSGGLLTLTGANFNSSLSSVVSLLTLAVPFGLRCGVLSQLSSSSALVCQLPYFVAGESELQADDGTVHTFHVLLRPGTSIYSNVFQITLTSLPAVAPATSGSSGPSRSTIVLAVVLPVLALVLAAAAVAAIQRRHRAPATFGTGSEGRSQSADGGAEGKWGRVVELGASDTD